MLPAENDLRLAKILTPTIQKMLHAGATPMEIATQFRYFAAHGKQQEGEKRE